MGGRLILGLMTALAASMAVAQEPAKRVPYWISLTAGEALMRTGPGRQFPAIWLYRRPGLPMKVVQVTESWRRVRDMDGAEGWMLVHLLSDRRTAVIAGGTRPVRAAPQPGARVLWMAEAGVVGRISECPGNGWCAFDAAGKKGFVAIADLWGIGPTEVVE